MPYTPRTYVRKTSRLRDAAVDPRPDDFLAPINAGEADPHGPLVVAPEIHRDGPKGIVPGPVAVDAPAEQDAQESALAEAVLVEDAEKPEAAAEMADDGAPSGNASKAEWVDYAVRQGADRDEAEGLSRRALMEQYG